MIEYKTWKKYSSPAGFYTINYPPNWNISIVENITNIYPPDETGSITISAFHGNLPNEILPMLINKSFEKENESLPYKTIENNGWSGIISEFERIEEDDNLRKWKVIAAKLGKVTVLLTANNFRTSINTEETYNRIILSLRLENTQ